MIALDIRHDRARRRFETIVEGERCVLDYALADRAMIITHVIVPPPVEGRGIAAELTRTALEAARTEGLRVIPQCPYADAYMTKHPEYRDLLAAR